MNLGAYQRWTTDGLCTLLSNANGTMVSGWPIMQPRLATARHILSTCTTDPAYWYSHYCIELRINSLFNHEIHLINEMAKGKMSMHVCMGKIGMHRRNFDAKSGPYYHPPREYRIMTHLHAHVLNIHWTMDDVFLCSPVPNEQFTNE